MVFNVNEIFYSLQGEGSRIGKPCVFVRLQGCNLRCNYCDTMYAVDMKFPFKVMTINEIIEQVHKYNCKFIEFTGGEPLIHNNINKLMDYFVDSGYEVAVETNGSIDISQYNKKIIKIMDIKCPSSGARDQNKYENIEHLQITDEVKFVISNLEDYEFSKYCIEHYNIVNYVNEIIFSPVQNGLDYKLLAEQILRDSLPVRMQLQLHKIIWGASAQGV